MYPTLTAEQKITVFKRELSYIESPIIRTIVEDLLSEVPNYFFEIPASSTGKYHPDYALGQGGLVRHTKAAALFANILSTPNPLNLTRFQLDCAIGAVILHDTRKSGLDDDVKSDYTRFDHPILAAKAILNTYGIDVPDMNNFAIYSFDPEMTRDVLEPVLLIAHAIASHMGQWNTSKYSPGIVLPTPTTAIQQFVHMCDYLASRKELDIKNLF